MKNKFKGLLLNTTRLLVSGFVVFAMVVSAAAQAGGHKEAAPEGGADIVDTAVNAQSFTTLVAAVQAAGLVDALKGEGPYTVFAPSDEAFAAFEEAWPGTLDSLLLPENIDQLTALLTYHVVPGKIMAADLSGTMTPSTLEGSPVTITVADNVTVDYATVVAADVEASNGVIHVIDAVIIPKSSGG